MADGLVTQVYPYLVKRDQEGLVRFVQRNWTSVELVSLLRSQDSETIKVAAMCLGYVGECCRCVNQSLVDVLQHDDSFVAQMAENALWNIWFRAGTDEANRSLRQAVQYMEQGLTQQAAALLDCIIEEHPDFAEPYNQRAIAWYLSGDYDMACEDCEMVVAHNPFHFGAYAGWGHSLVQQDNYRQALWCYRRAMQIHPRCGLDEAIAQIEHALSGSTSPTHQA